jgi:tetratricopeptide (TPR) repeat protein
MSMTRSATVCLGLLLAPALVLAGDFENAVEALKKNDLDLAITHFSAHLREHPTDANAFLARGRVFAGKNEYDKAIADFTEVIRLNPKDAPRQDMVMGTYKGPTMFSVDAKFAALLSRSEMHRNKREIAKAIADLDEATRIEPNFDFLFLNRGHLHFQRKDYLKARADYNETIFVEPRNFFGYSSLAWLLATCPREKLRDGKRAVEVATKACEMSDWKAIGPLNVLAAACAEKGDFKEAVKWQKKVLEIGFPDKEESQKARQRLALYEKGKPFRDE